MSDINKNSNLANLDKDDDEFKCPISQEVMRDPVSLACGHTFDRVSISEWLSANKLCPTCRKQIENEKSLSTNWLIKNLIEKETGFFETRFCFIFFIKKQQCDDYKQFYFNEAKVNQDKSDDEASSVSHLKSHALERDEKLLSKRPNTSQSKFWFSETSFKTCFYNFVKNLVKLVTAPAVSTTAPAATITTTTAINYNDGSVYNGGVLNGNKHGHGEFVWGELSDWPGDRYVGDYHNDQQHGRGKYFHANGDTYEGEWFEHKKHGEGVYLHANGCKYVGQWSRGNKHGFGVFTWGNGTQWHGDKYEGFYENDVITGYGTYTYANGNKYVYYI